MELRHISVAALKLKIENQHAFTLLDVRREAAKLENPSLISHARWLNPATWLDWKDTIASDKPVILYCAKGHEISQAMTACLCALGIDAVYLEGGMAAWQAWN